MVFSGFGAFFAWVGAALVVSAAGIRRRWVRADGRLQAAGMLLVVLLAQRATFLKPRRSRDASARTLKDETYFWLPVIAVCVLGLVVDASSKAVRRRRQRERMPHATACACKEVLRTGEGIVCDRSSKIWIVCCLARVEELQYVLCDSEMVDYCKDKLSRITTCERNYRRFPFLKQMYWKWS